MTIKRRWKTCVVCGEYKEHCARGKCRQCYQREHKAKKFWKICIICGEYKETYAKSMCHNCYYKERRGKRPQKICGVCGELKEHRAYGMCSQCYYKEHHKGPINTQSSSYLGCTVAERVLSKVFNDVKVMSYGNSGYDFICNKGKKIDVKSSCMGKNHHNYDRWLFRIRRNTIADFFLCIAFDDRESLTPLYLWLIPLSEVRGKKTTSISPNTLHKWDDFKLDISKTLQCCNQMRE